MHTTLRIKLSPFFFSNTAKQINNLARNLISLLTFKCSLVGHQFCNLLICTSVAVRTVASLLEVTVEASRAPRVSFTYVITQLFNSHDN